MHLKLRDPDTRAEVYLFATVHTVFSLVSAVVWILMLSKTGEPRYKWIKLTSWASLIFKLSLGIWGCILEVSDGAGLTVVASSLWGIVVGHQLFCGEKLYTLPDGFSPDTRRESERYSPLEIIVVPADEEPAVPYDQHRPALPYEPSC